MKTDDELLRESIKAFDEEHDPWKLKQPLYTSKPDDAKKGAGEVDKVVDEIQKANEAQAVLDKLEKKGYITPE
jgi:hypothetical protein